MHQKKLGTTGVNYKGEKTGAETHVRTF